MESPFTPIVEDTLSRLESMVEAALHNFEQTRDTQRVTQFMNAIVVPVAVALLHNVVGHRHALDPSFDRAIHYTSVSSLFSMLESGKMRLYTSDSANDPNEGAFFDQHSDLAKKFRWLKDVPSTPAYLGSFVISDSPSDQETNRDHQETNRDHLVYWRTYGDGGRGCSIEFCCSTRGLKKVLYGKSHVRAASRRLELLLPRISPLTELPSPIGTGVREVFGEAFNSLRYLYKSDDYEYEEECRLVVLRQQRSAGAIGLDYRRDHNGARQVRHYCHDDRLNLHEILNTTGTIVTIGPAAQSPRALSRSIHIALEKLGAYGAAVKTSRISFRTD